MALWRMMLEQAVRWPEPARVAEPRGVMDDEGQVSSYSAAAEAAEALGAMHLFHSAQACDVIRAGDRVLDLGCGPGRQLVGVAELNPGAKFVGVDLSEPMLARAREWAAERGVRNVEFVRGDVTGLAERDGGVDAVISSMALHHLRDEAEMSRCVAEVRRVLRPGGGIYVTDFLRLRSWGSMEHFVRAREGRDSAVFVEDFRNSLRAAFSWGEVRRAWAGFAGAKLHRSAVVGVVMAAKSAKRAEPDGRQREAVARRVEGLSEQGRRQLAVMRWVMRMGGLRGGLLG